MKGNINISNILFFSGVICRFKLGVGSKSRWSQILLAQNELGEDKWVKHKFTKVLKKCWNFAWLSTFSRQKVEIWLFLRKNKLKMIPDAFLVPFCTPNACLRLMLRFHTKISKIYIAFCQKKISSKTFSSLKFIIFVLFISCFPNKPHKN